MNLIDQVTNLELSEKLKSLNVKQESLFYYTKSSNPKSKYALSMDGCFSKTYHCNDMISAFTASELLEILPVHLRFETPVKPISKYDKGGICVFTPSLYMMRDESLSEDRTIPMFKFWYGDISSDEDSNLANALAKMLIHLIENSLIEV